MDKARLLKSIELLDRYLAANDWRGYDPFDGLSMPGGNLLTRGNHLLRIVLQQSIRRFPLNLRPVVGIKKMPSSKGHGFCALGYLLLYADTGDPIYLERSQKSLDWLIQNANPSYSGYCWGNHFSYESRHGTIPKGMPTIVWTSLIANTFIVAYEMLNIPKYLEVAKSCGDFILNDIRRLEVSDSQWCFMYTPPVNGQGASWNGCIHNSNVLGAWLLARLFRHTGDPGYLTPATKAIRFTARRQRPDGSWYYGEEEKYHWVDSFHTGYVLEAIHGYNQATGETEFVEALQKGYDYFFDRFFEDNGRPRYYNHKTFPIDIQCASQGIQTLVRLKSLKAGSVNLAKKVARWTLDHMRSTEGYFYYRKYPLMTNKTATFHWGQATMLSALSHLHHAI